MTDIPREISQLLEHLRSPECWADEDAAADEIERLMAENNELRATLARLELSVRYVSTTSWDPNVQGPHGVLPTRRQEVSDE